MPKAARKIPTATEVLARQKSDHRPGGISAPKPPTSGTAVVVAKTSTTVAVPDQRDSVEQYLDEVAPASIVGRMVKFAKDGWFITHDDGEPTPEDAEYVAHCDQTLIGRIKFNGDGAPPDRVMGLLYNGFVMPPREVLGDLDKSRWPLGLDKEPQDPWQHQMYLVLQHVTTMEFFTFVTASKTGRRAVGNLLKHYERVRKTYPDDMPVIRLKVGGFNHSDERIGWVKVPVLTVVGRRPRDSSAVPDTSPSGDMNDSIPL
jgi:hypothetical protein